MPAVLAGAAGVLLVSYFFQSIPLPDSIGRAPTVLLDASGRELGTLQPNASREDVALADLPAHVPDAVLAAEDAGFYEHGAISFVGIARAALSNVRAGGVNQGGSTISQQYIKIVTTDDERSMLRKVREAVLAFKLERQLTKDQILESYLNTIYFGRGAYGIEAAAKAYFGEDRSAGTLTEAEAALLAGIIQSPSRLDPRENPDGAVRRYTYVVGQMRENGWLEPATAERLLSPDQFPVTVEPATTTFKDAPFFLDLVRRELALKIGEDRMYTGLTVTTTLDLGVQRYAETAYHAAFDAIEPTGALVSIDPATGGVRALVGGEDYARDQLNLAIAQRQPGSTFKPFALAAWIDEGNSPESYFDAPAEITYAGAEIGEPNEWEVSNYEDAEYPPMSLREATWRSVNTVYAQVLADVGKEKVARMAQDAIATTPGTSTSEIPEVASVVLGTTAVSPLELAAAFNTFATGGIRRQPFTIAEIARDGRTLFSTPVRDERVFSEQVAWTVTEVLRGVIRTGTGSAADIGVPAAGKTGTTQNYGNAWFAGFTPHLTTVVWMGNRDNNERMAEELEPTGSGLPARTWAAFMGPIHANLPEQGFPEPKGGLIVTRQSPSPSPSPVECEGGEVEVVDDDGETTCASPEPSPSESASDVASPSPESSDDDEDEASDEPTTTATPTATSRPTATTRPTASAAPTSSGEPTATASSTPSEGETERSEEPTTEPSAAESEQEPEPEPEPEPEEPTTQPTTDAAAADEPTVGVPTP